uniref:Peptidase S1 domain-containing protein n=1 Tax=Anopheles maculatus TaxID=74869 RepID=A0A182SM91_9DIPT
MGPGINGKAIKRNDSSIGRESSLVQRKQNGKRNPKPAPIPKMKTLRTCSVVQAVAIFGLLTVASALPQRSNSPNARIAGGEDAADGQFPFQVALINEGLVYCGGTVLNRRWVLTAAACITGKALSDVQLFVGSA